MTALATVSPSHEGLDPVDLDLLLTEATEEVAMLRERLLLTEANLAQAEHRADMFASLNQDLSKRHDLAVDRAESLETQVKILHEELAAAEKDAIPADAVVAATLSREEMVATYRGVSRITRGPLPPSVLAAVDAAQSDIREAMTAAGREILGKAIRREVQRRRRARGAGSRR